MGIGDCQPHGGAVLEPPVLCHLVHNRNSFRLVSRNLGLSSDVSKPDREWGGSPIPEPCAAHGEEVGGVQVHQPREPVRCVRQRPAKGWGNGGLHATGAVGQVEG